MKALIVVRQGESLTEEQVIAHCKEKLGGVKAPKSVELRVEIPKTPAGKIDRKKLRAPYWQGTSTMHRDPVAKKIAIVNQQDRAEAAWIGWPGLE